MEVEIEERKYLLSKHLSKKELTTEVALLTN
jgi:hypothetical protein